MSASPAFLGRFLALAVLVFVTSGFVRAELPFETVFKGRERFNSLVAQGEKLKVETVDAARTEAKAEAGRILAAAQAEIQQEISRARESLRNQVSDLAVAGASQILKREVDAKAHADLLAEIRKEL